MIFVTVGTQIPFDRLVRTVDEWAGRTGRADVFAQIGDSRFAPRHLEAVPSLSPDEFEARFAAADVVVAHAGMGTILGALEFGSGIGGAVGTWVAGWAFDVTGSYQAPLLIVLASTAAPALFIWLIAPRTVRRVVAADSVP